MIRLKALLCLLLCATTARAETTLRFAATIEDETLAEDAILLAHCLAERSGRSWEFTTDVDGPLWLKVHEEGREAVGTYHRDGKDLGVRMKTGESDQACDHLEPATGGGRIASAAPPPSLGLPTPPALESTPYALKEPPPEPSNGVSKGWLWAAAGGVALVAGLLIWRGRQPSFRNVSMN